jgi:hypothetical protein
MLEGDAVVHAERAVYDPQNAQTSSHFGANGSTARELALILNRHEAELLTGRRSASTHDLANALLDRSAATTVVVKEGPLGALVHDGTATHTVPAYKSKRVWKIGSGDAFVAHFAYRWLHEARTAVESADMASKATSFYCETMGFPSLSTMNSWSPPHVPRSKRDDSAELPRVYLAGPFFTLAQLWMIEQARASLRNMGLNVFSPYHNVGHGSAVDVVGVDLAAIDEADAVFAICDGMDPGTVYEIGYARAKGKTVILYCENESVERKKMMEGSACLLLDDFVSAVYATTWAACEA